MRNSFSHKSRHFVPNLTLGFPIIQALRKKLPKVYFDCHCMISEPGKWVKELAASGADLMTFHYEATIRTPSFTVADIKQLCKEIKERKMSVGVAIKPKTEVSEELLKLVEEKLVDMVLVMTVEPGFGGQKFMEDMMPKVETLRKKYPHLNIQVDGGITVENVSIVGKAGANVIVAGTGIYKHKDPAAAISEIRRIINETAIIH
eukprot:TRINITY_DN2912_c0_g2_i11.p1 TRINITY_DN2912_c0_g2~~TRINITY_DN2912_c0_g2_i11.p1  ORF type:complete len:204 (-),score=59.07 TRINITY_DN2912_c0_g2_i11:31-642(-)